VIAQDGAAVDAGRALDALLGLVRAALKTGYTPPSAISDLARELHGRAMAQEAASELGSREADCETIGGVRKYGTPDEAGSAVGLTGRRVRQLCDAGLVAHRVIGKNRKLVDLEDLQRHLRGDAA
jgi:hypothetical protein